MLGDQLSCPLHRLATLVLVVACTVPVAAAAQSQPVSYPPSRSLADVTAWIRTDTPLAPGQVVDVGVSAVTAITAATPTTAPRGFLATVSSESLDPSIEGSQGIASWMVPVQVDCDARRVKLGAMTGYPRRDLAKDARIVRPADADFITPTTGAPIDAVVRGLCDRDFRRPLMGGRQLAKAPEPVRPPTKVAEAPAPPSSSRSTLPSTPPPQRTPVRVGAPAGSSAAVVQVGASPDLADAKGLLARIQRKFAAELQGRTGTIATVQLDGKTMHRALISGFGSAAEANDLCKTLSAAGQACFIRR